jgi:hypothetical protein
LDKRQCTLQLLIRPEVKQPVPCLIFRGAPKPTGKKRTRDRREEEEEYERVGEGDVLVLWQKKAWADFDTCLKWTTEGLGKFVETQDELKTLPAGDIEQRLRVPVQQLDYKRQDECDRLWWPPRIEEIRQ